MREPNLLTVKTWLIHAVLLLIGIGSGALIDRVLLGCRPSSPVDGRPTMLRRVGQRLGRWVRHASAPAAGCGRGAGRGAVGP
jgi:hypothetical protein